MNLYNQYYDILKHVYNIMNLTDNEELREVSRKTIVNTINQLIEKDIKNKKNYESILEEFGLVEKITDTSIQENISNGTENSINSSDYQEEYKNIDEYVFNKIYRNENKALGNEFQNIMRGLIDSLRNNDRENIVVYKNKYDKFVTDNKDILDVDKLNEYYKKICVEYKIEEKKDDIKKDDVEQNDIKEKVEEPKKKEGFKILNVKRNFNSKLKNRALSLLALAGIGTFNPLIATGIGIGAYYLYKKGIKNARSLIESNGLNLDENENLIDVNGKIINEEEIGKIKYNLIKRELSKVKNGGRIDVNYKKNKLTSMLLSVPSKLFKNIKNKYEQIKINREKVSEEVSDMNKGLGITK